MLSTMAHTSSVCRCRRLSRRTPHKTSGAPHKSASGDPTTSEGETRRSETLLGSESVTTNGTGNGSIAFSTTKAIRLGQNITATGPGGNASEFSAPRKVVLTNQGLGQGRAG